MFRVLDLPPLILLAISVFFAAAAEYLLTIRPKLVELPPWVEDALRPMWPDVAAVLGAIGCFAVAAVVFTLASRVAIPSGDSGDPGASVRVLRNASGAPRRAVLGGLAVGLLLWALVVVGLATSPTDATLPAKFLVALLALVGSLTVHEWRRLRPTTWHVGRAAVLELLLVLALLGVFAFLAIFDLADWYYSSIGDEHAFFLLAKDFALGTSERSLFDQKGAYGIIPVLSAFFEGTQMRIFGVTGFGWKVATITPLILTLPATYVLARTLFNRRVALLTLGVLATSHYLLAYGHSGYPNLEALLPGVLALLLFVVGINRSSMVLLIGAGLVAGLGWYTYYTARTAIVFLAAATLLMVKPRDWAATAAPLTVGFGFMVLPLFAVSKLDVLNKMFEQTGAATTTEVAANRALLPLWNTGRSVLAFNYNTHDGVWLSGSLVDPLTGALFVLGMVWVLARWGEPRSRLVLAWFAIGLAIAGILSKYDYVSVSRLNLLVPTVCLLCGIAAEGMARLLEQQGPRRLSRFVFPSILVGCTALAGWGNLARWFVTTPGSVPTTPTSVAIRIVEDPRCQTAPRPPIIVDVGIGGAVLPALDAAGPRVLPDFGLYQDTPTWIDTADSRCVIFRAPHDAESQTLQHALDNRWPASHAVQECDRSGIVRLVAYYPLSSGQSDRASLACPSRQA